MDMYSDEFESHSEDEGVEQSPKDNESHHSSGRHSLSRSFDALSANSLTANPSTPSTPEARRRKRRRNSTKPSTRAGKVKKAPKNPPHPPTDLSAISERSKSIVVVAAAAAAMAKRSGGVVSGTHETRVRIAPDSPLDRVLRVKDEKIRRITNDLAVVERQLEEIRQENRLLKRLHHRHSKALEKFENAEADLPQILARHSAEMEAVRKRLKKTQEAHMNAERISKERNEEIWKLRMAVNEVTKLSGDKHLLERDRLRSYLEKSAKTLDEQMKKGKDLEKKIDVQEKAHYREVRDWKIKYRSMQQEAKEWKDKYDEVHLRLREKEKELEVMNIYSKRIAKNLPKTLPSILGSCDKCTMTEKEEEEKIDSIISPVPSIADSVTIGTPSVVSLNPPPRAPSQPRPRNMPRKNSPVPSSEEENQNPLRSAVSIKAEAAVGPDLSTFKPEKSSYSSLGSGEESKSKSSLEDSSQKDSLLAKLKAIDEHKDREETSRTESSVFITSPPKNPTVPAKAPAEDTKKDLLLARLREIDKQENQDEVPNKKEEEISKADRVSLLLGESNKNVSLSKANQVNQLLGLDSDKVSTTTTTKADKLNQMLGGGGGETTSVKGKDEDAVSNVSKTSSSRSWKVENMHSGRPAHSTGNNYYGGGSGTSGTNNQRKGSSGIERRHKPPLSGGLAKLEKREDDDDDDDDDEPALGQGRRRSRRQLSGNRQGSDFDVKNDGVRQTTSFPWDVVEKKKKTEQPPNFNDDDDIEELEL